MCSRRRRLRPLWTAVLLLGGLGTGRAQVEALGPGDIVVVDGGTGPSSAILVDRLNGLRALISTFGSSADPAFILAATSVAADAERRLVVVGRTRTSTRLVRIDPGVGPHLVAELNGGVAVAVEASGALVVAEGPVPGPPRIVRIDPETGGREVVSALDDPAAGPTVMHPAGLAVESSATGALLLADAGDAMAGGRRGSVVRIDPASGARTLVSDFGDSASGAFGFDPTDVTVETSGDIIVVDAHATPASGASGRGALFRVDPSTGRRAVLSDFNVGMRRPRAPTGVAIEASGAILVIDPSRQLLFRVDPLTGARAIVSDMADGTLGYPARSPTDVAVVPGIPPEPTTTTTRPVVASTTTTTTTSTLPPPQCRIAADCLDADPCSDDTCAGGRCLHSRPATVPRVACDLRELVAEPLCPEGALKRSVERFVAGRVQTARKLVDRAAVASKRQRWTSSLRRAEGQLDAALRKLTKSGAPASCTGRLGPLLTELRTTVSALRTSPRY